MIGFGAGFLENGPIKNSSLIIATIFAGIPILVKAYQSLRMKAFSIDLLVTIAVIGAVSSKTIPNRLW